MNYSERGLSCEQAAHAVNFALAIGRFDPRVYQPDQPGYFLYISLGRLLNFLVTTPISSSPVEHCRKLRGDHHDLQDGTRLVRTERGTVFKSFFPVFSPRWFHGITPGHPDHRVRFSFPRLSPCRLSPSQLFRLCIPPGKAAGRNASIFDVSTQYSLARDASCRNILQVYFLPLANR